MLCYLYPPSHCFFLYTMTINGPRPPPNEKLLAKRETGNQQVNHHHKNKKDITRSKLIRMVGAVWNFLKAEYEGFPPLFKWKIKDAPNLSFIQILAICRVAQYFVVGSALLLTLLFEHSRSLFTYESVSNGIFLLIMELGAYPMLGHLLGLKRFPVGYLSLTMMKFFLILEQDLKPEVKGFQAKVTEKVAPPPNVQPNPSLKFGASVAQLVLFATLVPLLLKLGKAIDFTKYERTLLVSTFVGTTSAALLLFSSFAFETYPEFREVHKGLCELWVVLGITLFVMIAIFFFQHFIASINGQRKPLHSYILLGRLMFECCIFLFALYIMLSYIPVIHRGLSVSELLGRKNWIIAQKLVPRDLWTFGQAVARYGKNTFGGKPVFAK